MRKFISDGDMAKIEAGAKPENPKPGFISDDEMAAKEAAIAPKESPSIAGTLWRELTDSQTPEEKAIKQAGRAEFGLEGEEPTPIGGTPFDNGIIASSSIGGGIAANLAGNAIKGAARPITSRASKVMEHIRQLGGKKPFTPPPLPVAAPNPMLGAVPTPAPVAPPEVPVSGLVKAVDAIGSAGKKASDFFSGSIKGRVVRRILPGSQTGADLMQSAPEVIKGGAAITTKTIDAVAPQLGKFGPLLQEAAKRGGSALGSMDFILQQKDPEYQELRKNLEQ